jgi:hypothetical protein
MILIIAGGAPNSSTCSSQNTLLANSIFLSEAGAKLRLPLHELSLWR